MTSKAQIMTIFLAHAYSSIILHFRNVLRSILTTESYSCQNMPTCQRPLVQGLQQCSPVSCHPLSNYCILFINFHALMLAALV